MGFELLLFFLCLCIGFYMAFNIGANDIANAMGTSVGSKALSIQKAVLIAAIFEFSGAFLAGEQVTQTIRKGILDVSLFASTPYLFAVGMTLALLSTALWLQIASFKGLPVSTTHSIVGAVLGFGFATHGIKAIHFKAVLGIAFSWLLSPFLGGIIAFCAFFIIRKYILDSKNPIQSMNRFLPALLFFVLSFSLISFAYKSMQKLGFFSTFFQSVLITSLFAFSISLLLWVALYFTQKPHNTDRKQALERVERIFALMQIITACLMALAHGSNDVANAVGPIAAVLSVMNHHSITDATPVPFWLLAFGGVGMIVGLMTFGKRVIATVGEGITEITPTRGFAAEFGAATTIMLGSACGIPLSTTQVLVGGIIGVGLARGIAGLNATTVRQIMGSWILTIPATALLSGFLSLCAKHFI